MMELNTLLYLSVDQRPRISFGSFRTTGDPSFFLSFWEVAVSAVVFDSPLAGVGGVSEGAGARRRPLLQNDDTTVIL